MAKENTGPRSRYGKILIKALARSWEKDSSADGIPRELRKLFEDFRAGGFDTEKKADAFYQETVEGLLGHLEQSGNRIVNYRLISKNLTNPGSTATDTPVSTVIEDEDLGWMDDDSDVAMGGLFDESLVEEDLSELQKELIDYVDKVAKAWAYKKPFFFRRSTVNNSILFVVTSVGTSKKTNVKTNVNVAVGAVKLPEIGEEHLFYERGLPLKYGWDSEDGRTYWGWAFKIIDGTTLRFWMSRVYGYDRRNEETWEQRARVVIKLNSSAPRGYRVLSAKHEDRNTV